MRTLLLVLALLALPPIASAGDADDPLEQGLQLLRGADHDKGVALLRGVIEETKDAQDARSLERLGRAHFYLQEDEQAIAAFERAAALEPRNALHPYWLGIVWKYSDLEKAVAAEERAVALDPTATTAWYELGDALRRLGRGDQALAAFQKVLALDPDDARAHYHVAVLLQEAQKDAEAVPHYERALEIDPGFVNAAYNLGLLHYLAGRYEPALAAWTAAAEHAPEDLQLAAKVIQALYALDRRAEAASWREKVLEIRRTSTRDEVRALKEFCFDQFRVDGKRVLAYERFDTSGLLAYVYVFKVLEDDDVVLSVNLETDGVAREMGAPSYVLGADEGDTHLNYGIWWREIPAYPELKALVLRAVRGDLPVRARSRRGSISVEMDR